MEDKIEVGEYGKTNLGNIITFAWLENADGVRYENKVILIKEGRAINEFYYFKENEKIVKHSKHKLKLIEIDDYVNGYKVLAIEKHFQVQPYRISIMVYKTKDAEFWKSLEEETIEDIVTHEQFENVKYKV